jgi:hypothetical protein
VPTFDVQKFSSVKTNLAVFAAIWLSCLEYATWAWFLTPDQRQMALTALAQIGLEQVSSVPGVLGVNYLVGWVLIELDTYKVWDDFAVRWRKKYAIELVILPLLSHQDKLQDDQYKCLAKFRKDAMGKLFYRFMDESSPQIERRLVTRAHTALQYYWACHLLEMALCAGLVATALLAAVDTAQGRPTDGVSVWFAALAAAAGVNRWKLRPILKEVLKRATNNEVEAIREAHQADLDVTIEELRANSELAWIPAPPAPPRGLHTATARKNKSAA